jgi:hypothetical protein
MIPAVTIYEGKNALRKHSFFENTGGGYGSEGQHRTSLST